MAPAFSSVRQAGGFAPLLLITLLSPVLVGKKGLPPRDSVYASISWMEGAFPFLHQEIFEKKSDIDIAFVGSSHMYMGIDAPYVQKKLSQQLGRPATVVSLGWSRAGLDNFYFITRDLLQNRKVRLLVFYDDQGVDQPHRYSWQLVRFGDDWKDLAGLPWRNRLVYYYGAILGLPRNIYSLFRRSSSPDLTSSIIRFAPWKGVTEPFHLLPTENLGAYTAELNLNRSEPFAPFAPQPGAQPSDTRLYSPATEDQFEFLGPEPAPLQVYFAQKLTALARAHGTKLVCLNIPIFADRKASRIQEGKLWPEMLNQQCALIGIPPTKLFAGMNDESVSRLFLNSNHFNENGQRYFTRLITPSLLEYYEPAHP